MGSAVCHLYGPTERYSNTPTKLAKQQTRDALKQEICRREGIRLVVVHAEDLSLEGMLRKIGNLLPLRSLFGKELIIDYLEHYRARALGGPGAAGNAKAIRRLEGGG